MLMRLTDYIAVDAMVNPNQALATVIMKQVRYPFGTGALSIIDEIDAEVLELTIPTGAPSAGRDHGPGAPEGVLIALVSRGTEMFVPWGNSVLGRTTRSSSFPRRN